jgi:hypothetical protein
MVDQVSVNTATARFCIKTPLGEIEAEGPVDYVEKRWDDVQSVLNRMSEANAQEQLATRLGGSVQKDNTGSQIQENKRNGAKKRVGTSCGSRIAAIQEGGFFTSPKKAIEVVEKLVELATPYEGKHVAAALIYMTSTGKLRRLKEGGEWAYVNP